MADQLLPRRIHGRIHHEIRGDGGRMVEQLLRRILRDGGKMVEQLLRRILHDRGRMAEQLLPRRIRGRIHHEMSNDGTGGDGGSYTVTIGTPNNEMVPKLEEKDEQLLPGILNDITLNHIATKVPWRALYILSLVSPNWQRAIQSRRVYDAIVRTHSTETLLVHCHKFRGGRDFQALAMFSTREKRCYELPPIPQLDGGIPNHWHYVSLDGKVYVLGGLDYDSRRKCFVGPEDSAHGGNKLYVLDLMGQRPWKQCASMQRQRYRFGVSAMNGKIYVFGGQYVDLELLPRSEVYDPNVDAWSEIMPMPRLRVNPRVGIIGDELYVYGGACYEPNANRRLQEAKFADVYHVVKDEWRVIDPFGRNTHECVFVAYGQFYSMTGQRICTYDSGSNSWKDLHSNSFPAVGSIGSRVLPCSAVCTNDELLALLYWFNGPSHEADTGACFIKSEGFGRKGREVTWQIVSNCPSSW